MRPDTIQEARLAVAGEIEFTAHVPDVLLEQVEVVQTVTLSLGGGEWRGQHDLERSGRGHGRIVTPFAESWIELSTGCPLSSAISRMLTCPPQDGPAGR